VKHELSLEAEHENQGLEKMSTVFILDRERFLEGESILRITTGKASFLLSKEPLTV